MNVAIYLLSRGFDVWQWLCPKHLEAAKNAGWEVRSEKPGKPWLTCDWRFRGACS
jgi:hypothetical protein